MADEAVRAIVPVALKIFGGSLLGRKKKETTVYVDSPKPVSPAVKVAALDPSGRGYGSMFNRNFIRRDDDGGSGGRFIS